MKFCKDCKHYRPPIVDYKCAIPAACFAAKGKGTGEFDPVTGDERRYSGSPYVLRSEGAGCGPDAEWFEPGTLDGRLAALEA
jgi:hypothetical protein